MSTPAAQTVRSNGDVARRRAPLSVLMLDGDHDVSLFVARCLAATKSIELHGVAESADVPLRWSCHRHSFHCHEPCDDPSRVAFLADVARQTGARILFPVMEPAVEFAARNREELTRFADLIPVPEDDALQTAIDKAALARFSQQQRLPIPETVVVDGLPESIRQFASLRYPVVAKPCREMNGEGIEKLASIDAVEEYLARHPATVARPVVVQTYHAGYDIDCSVLCQRGQIRAYTCQRGVSKADDEFLPPDTIQFVHRRDVLDLAERLMAALDWTGVAHLDMRYSVDADELMLLEVNGRFWGTVMGSMYAGVNFPYLSCLAALGEEFSVPAYEARLFAHVSAAVRDVLPWRRSRQNHTVRWRDTPLWYGLADPIAETVRQIQLRKSR